VTVGLEDIAALNARRDIAFGLIRCSGLLQSSP